jgi:Zinc finger, C2H2 type
MFGLKWLHFVFRSITSVKTEAENDELIAQPVKKKKKASPTKKAKKPEPNKHHGSYLARRLLHYCCRCTATFQSEEEALGHFLVLHYDHQGPIVQLDLTDRRKVPCPLCRRVFADPRCLLYHRRRRHYNYQKPPPPPNWPCRTCDQVWSSSTGRMLCEERHKAELNNEINDCKICGKVFRTSSYLRSHQKQVHEKPTFTCEVCGELCHTSAKFESHMRKHTRFFFCDVCKKPFRRKDELQVHLCRHFSRRDFPCHLCEKAFYGAHGTSNFTVV